MLNRQAGRREFLAALAGGLGREPAAKRLEGTMVQLWREHLEWGEAQWAALFALFRDLGLREIVLQWTRWGEIDYTELAGALCRRARTAGLRVWLGLWAEPEWWRRVEAGPASLEGLLRRQSERHKAQMTRLRGWSGVRGYYVPEEFEGEHWGGAGEAELVREYLRSLGAARLRVSGFAAGGMRPARAGWWWRQALRGTGTELLWQDGVGTGRVGVEEAELYLDELRRALRDRVRPIVELFEESPAGGLRAAPWGRVERQLRAAGRGAVGFAAPEYLNPGRDEEAAALYRSYHQFFSKPGRRNR